VAAPERGGFAPEAKGDHGSLRAGDAPTGVSGRRL